MNELIAALMLWIAGETGFAIPGPPLVVMLPREQMSVIAYGRSWEAGDDVRGAYNREAGILYLDDAWRIDDLRSRATLLHELVHHLEMYNGAFQEDCQGPREAQAYELTFRYLRKEGATDPYAVMKIDEFTVMVATKCAD